MADDRDPHLEVLLQASEEEFRKAVRNVIRRTHASTAETFALIEERMVAREVFVPAMTTMLKVCERLARQVAALEKRAAAGGAGVTIIAKEGLEFVTPGLPEVAEAIEKLSRVMAAPVVPEHDANGRLVSAQRRLAS